MQLPDLPKGLPANQVDAALDTLSLPTERLLEVTIRNDVVEVTYLRTDSDGEVIGGSRITTSINIRRPR